MGNLCVDCDAAVSVRYCGGKCEACYWETCFGEAHAERVRLEDLLANLTMGSPGEPGDRVTVDAEGKVHAVPRRHTWETHLCRDCGTPIAITSPVNGETIWGHQVPCPGPKEGG